MSLVTRDDKWTCMISLAFTSGKPDAMPFTGRGREQAIEFALHLDRVLLALLAEYDVLQEVFPDRFRKETDVITETGSHRVESKGLDMANWKAGGTIHTSTTSVVTEGVGGAARPAIDRCTGSQIDPENWDTDASLPTGDGTAALGALHVVFTKEKLDAERLEEAKKHALKTTLVTMWQHTSSVSGVWCASMPGVRGVSVGATREEALHCLRKAFEATDFALL